MSRFFLFILEGVTFHSLLLFKSTRCLLLVVKSLITSSKIYSLLVAEVARCKTSLVTRCKICSFLVEEVACCKNHPLAIAKFVLYSLQMLLVENIYLLLYLILVARFPCYILQDFPVTRWRCCSLKKITRHLLLRNQGTNIHLKPIRIGDFYLFILYLELTKNRERFCVQKINIAKI